MKKPGSYIKTLLLFFSCFCLKFSHAQGRVVINEYMPWASGACGTTSEFIELLNFGPGPMNIGCYIVSTGQYSITIPPNTILQPGQFFVLSGQDILSTGCGNIDSAVHVGLNWNTCHCTNVPIPTTGDGLMTDGGNANVNLVLLDPNLKVVDAVTRALPTNPSSPITTSSVAGGCSSKSYNLDSMTINYEQLGMSTGKANSFARRVDGDCEWIKTPLQSANSTNNETGNAPSVNYSFTPVQASDCNGGSITITLNSPNASSLFPMNYTLAYDSNKNGSFDLNDSYTTGISNNPPYVSVSGLPAGMYRITVASALGCDLKSFDFSIFPCGAVMPVQLEYFRLKPSGQQYTIEWLINGAENLDSIVLEKAIDNTFLSSQKFVPKGSDFFTASEPASSPYQYFRLKLFYANGSVFYSPVINSRTSLSFSLNKIFPNPAKDQLNFELNLDQQQELSYSIYNCTGMTLSRSVFSAKEGFNQSSVSIQNLPAGIYRLVFTGSKTEPISFGFVKQ